VIKLSGITDLQGVKNPIFQLTLLVIVTTLLCYRTDCEKADQTAKSALNLLNTPAYQLSYSDITSIKNTYLPGGIIFGIIKKTNYIISDLVYLPISIKGVPQWQPHRRSGMANLPSVGAIS